MTAPNSPQPKSNKLTSYEEAYLLGEVIGDVVERIDRQINLDTESELQDKLDRVAKDRLQWEKNRADTYESRSKEIDRKWKRY